MTEKLNAFKQEIKTKNSQLDAKVCKTFYKNTRNAFFNFIFRFLIKIGYFFLDGNVRQRKPKV
jgi:hypothetical protein